MRKYYKCDRRVLLECKPVWSIPGGMGGMYIVGHDQPLYRLDVGESANRWVVFYDENCNQVFDCNPVFADTHFTEVNPLGGE